MVTHQLQVERRTGKVRQSETDVLPLCRATNQLIAAAVLIGDTTVDYAGNDAVEHGVFRVCR